jgi:BASS family bile acid:Na+ symporter
MHQTLQHAVRIAVQVAIPIAAFVTGLRAASAEPLWLFKRPGLLFRSLAAILIVVPVGTVLFLRAVAAPPLVAAGITVAVLAIGIGPPAALKRTKAHEESISYEVALNVLLLMLAIVYIPLAVAVHGAVFGHNLRLSPSAVARVVLGRALVPLAVGAFVGRAFPRAIAPLGRYLGAIVQVVLIAVVVLALVVAWHGLLELGLRTWLTCAAVVLGEIAIGHFMGGPAPETRHVLASFSAYRFPALALLLAQVAPRGREFLPVILAYVIATMVLVGIYDALTVPRERRGRARAGRAATAGRA